MVNGFSKEVETKMFNHFQNFSPDCWNELRIFYIAAKEGSFSKAAVKLNLSQPSVARACRRVQDVYGEELFLVAHDGISLTSSGNRVYLALCGVNFSISTIFKERNQKNADVQGIVRISVPEGLAGVFVAPNITKFMDEYPGVFVEVVNPATKSGDELVDMTVCFGNGDARYDYTKIGFLHLTTISSKKYISAVGQFDLRDIFRLKFVNCLYYQGPIFASWADLCSKGHCSLKIESSVAYAAAVVNNSGIGLLANYTLMDSRLEHVELGVDIKMPLFLGQLKTRRKSKAIDRFSSWIINLFVEESPWFRGHGSLKDLPSSIRDLGTTQLPFDHSL